MSMKSFADKLVRLFESGKKLEIIQYAYVVLFVIITLVAGLMALIKQSVGVSFLIIPLICIVSFAMNIVTWSIAKMAIEHYSREDVDKLFDDKKDDAAVEEKEEDKEKAKRIAKNISKKAGKIAKKSEDKK